LDDLTFFLICGESIARCFVDRKALGSSNTTSMHFIGHSFGTAITSEAVERLASFQKTVDLVTCQNPHDFDQNIIPIDGSQHLWTLAAKTIPADELQPTLPHKTHSAGRLRNSHAHAVWACHPTHSLTTTLFPASPSP
jgi:hypothetical protein